MNLYGVREYRTEAARGLDYRREHWFVAEDADQARRLFKGTAYARECRRIEIREIEHDTADDVPCYKKTFGM